MPPKRIIAGVYGPPKRGKTLGLIGGYPLALFSTPGDKMEGLDSAEWLGLDISKRSRTANTIEDVIETTKNYGGKFPALVFDDMSRVFDLTYQQLREKFKGNANKYIIPDTFNGQVHEMFAAFGDVPCDILLSFWEQPPRETTKGTLPGAPLIQGWSWPEKLPGLLSFIARVVYDDTFKGWPYVYQTGPDPVYITGDRYSITPPRFPQNMGEILRAAGREIGRPKEFGWMEGAVESIAGQLLDKEKTEGFVLPDFLREKQAKLADKVKDPRHVRWCLKDALDRANLRRVRANLVDDFINNITGNVPGQI